MTVYSFERASSGAGELASMERVHSSPASITSTHRCCGVNAGRLINWVWQRRRRSPRTRSRRPTYRSYWRPRAKSVTSEVLPTFFVRSPPTAAPSSVSSPSIGSKPRLARVAGHVLRQLSRAVPRLLRDHAPRAPHEFTDHELVQSKRGADVGPLSVPPTRTPQRLLASSSP